ncbi:MAG: hypothetical protein IT452_03730 [Planctomycetia bacterium]|nr:hypothetical protein [Planctomycetia bacterium]
MRDPRSLAAAWLAPPPLSFWGWTDGGRVAAWRDGGTIAFREEIAYAAARLAPAGLPPFGALILLLAACRPGWKDAGRSALRAHVDALEKIGSLDGRFPPPWLDDVLAALDRVAALRIELRTGADAKAHIAAMAFEGTEGRGTPDEGAAIARAVEEGAQPEARETETVSKWLVFRFLQDLAVLRQGLARVTDEALELRMRTGLEQLPGAAAVPDEVAAEAVRRLIADLREDRELAGVARLAADLMAAVHVPRRVSDPEELPLGGVSDIANRGPLDRLLVSELAHDELTLATRIALNEALYLRREQPPRNLPGRRAILVDAGIRMWGVPRVFAAAVSLALAATADRFTSVSAFRPSDDGLEPVDLTAREGLVSLLESLRPEPVPAGALGAFLGRMEAVEGPLDAILVTHEDVLADPEFSGALARLDDRALDVATVGADGRYRMWSVTARGRRLVKEAALSLEAILAPPRPELRGIPLLAPDRDASMPVILSVDPLPFLLPHEVEAKRTCAAGEGILAATRDGRLMLWENRDTAARQLTDRLPRGVLHWIAADDQGLAFALVGSSRSALHLVTADIASGRCTVARLAATGYPPASVFRHHEALVLAYARKLDVFDLHSGELREVFPIEHGASWGRGRYFFDNAGWACVAFDGRSAAITRVPGAPLGAGFLEVFDRRGVDGPWAVTTRGTAVNLADRGELAPKCPFPAAGAVVAVSRDGHRIAVRGAGAAARRHAILDLQRSTATEVYGDPLLALEERLPVLPRRSVRHKFATIGVAAGHLLLAPSSGVLRQVVLSPDGRSLLLQPRPDVETVVLLPFAGASSPRGARFGLKVASWKGGSRAWTDSRGMLHLRSGDSRLPEVSLVLTDESPLAAWSSDGRLAGPRYFTGDRANAEPAELFASISRFLEAL